MKEIAKGIYNRVVCSHFAVTGDLVDLSVDAMLEYGRFTAKARNTELIEGLKNIQVQLEVFNTLDPKTDEYITMLLKKQL